MDWMQLPRMVSKELPERLMARASDLVVLSDGDVRRRRESRRARVLVKARSQPPQLSTPPRVAGTRPVPAERRPAA